MRLVYITLGWAGGIVLASRFSQLSSLLWLEWAALALVAVWLLRRDFQWRRLAIVIVAFALGGLRYSVVPQTSEVARFNNDGGAAITGIVIDEPDVRDERVQFRVEVERIFHATYDGPVSGWILVQTTRGTPVQYGDRIHATGGLIAPAEADTFSYADFLARSGVFSILPNASVEIESGGHGSPFIATLLNIKSRAQTFIGEALPDPQAGLLTGILLGNENGLSPALADDFSATGASHVIAISGFNMAIISGVLMGLLGRLLPERKWLAALIGITFIVLYTLLVGANSAVVRAALMSSMLVIAPLFKRKTYVPASLAFVVIGLSTLNPTILWDVSFQLSFLAVLGLALFTEPLTRWFDKLLNRLLPRWVADTLGSILNEPIVASIAAQITTLPLIVMYFQRVSLVSLMVNVLILPVQPALLIIGGLAVLLAFILPGIALVLFWIDFVLLAWTIAIVRLFARLPFADVGLSIDPRLIGLFFAILIGGAVMQAARPTWFVRFSWGIRRRAVLATITLCGAALAILLVGIALSRPDGYLHVWLLDMGHSHATLVQSPGGAQVLVDGGRFPSRLLTALGDRMPFYDRKIEILAITQPDEFDVSALPAVLARYDIGATLRTSQINLSDTVTQIDSALAGQPSVTVRAGYTVNFDDGLRLEVLHPQGATDLSDNINDHTMALRLVFGDVSFLLTGDMSVTAQSNLLTAGAWPLASVMQLPQHGAARSLNDDFLNAVQPQIVVLQSDITNRRGDPDPDTIARVSDKRLFRTDQGGTIHLWTDGKTLWAQQER